MSRARQGGDPSPASPTPGTTRSLLSGVGRVLIGFGVLVLLFVAYLLWGTGISEASHQHALRQQFEHELAGIKGHSSSSTSTSTSTSTSASTPSSTPSSCSTTSTPDSSTTSTPGSSTATLHTSGAQPPVPGTVPTERQPVGVIQIPKIGVNKVVVEGTATADLHLGPGHYPGTPLPGQPGNAAIAGHRTTYGAPFYNLNELVPGDPIFVTTTQGLFLYCVTHVLVVSPSDLAIVAPSPKPELTLTTCNPRFSASQRLVVQASLHTPPATIPDHPTQSRPLRSSSSSLAGEQGSWTGALGWGLTCLAVGIGLWALARTRRRPGIIYGLGAVPLLVVLFLFFENLSPLLPASF